MSNNEISVFFELELNERNNYPYNKGYHYKSARSAFYSFLKSEI